MTVLEVKDLTGGYTRKPVIHNLYFALEPGELVGLIGLNGAGKSTTIKHIIGMMQPQKGEIRINGKTMQENMDIYRTSFSYIPEFRNDGNGLQYSVKRHGGTGSAIIERISYGKTT